jgi:hypothetical protein
LVGEDDELSHEAEEVFVPQGLSEIVVLSDLGEEMGTVFEQGQQLLKVETMRRGRIRLTHERPATPRPGSAKIGFFLLRGIPSLVAPIIMLTRFIPVARTFAP